MFIFDHVRPLLPPSRKLKIIFSGRYRSNLGNRLRLVADLISWNRVDLGSKFIYTQIWRKEYWGAKISKIVHFLTNRYTIQSCMKYKKIYFHGKLRDGYEGFSLFGLENGLLLYYHRSKLRWWYVDLVEVTDVPLGVSISQTPFAPLQPQNVIF